MEAQPKRYRVPVHVNKKIRILGISPGFAGSIFLACLFSFVFLKAYVVIPLGIFFYFGIKVNNKNRAGHPDYMDSQRVKRQMQPYRQIEDNSFVFKKLKDGKRLK